MPIPIPQLDDKQFEALVNEARLLIPRHAPTWTDHNLHDPGITLIELFAWLAEMQIYTLDRVTDRHIEKFLRLLGFSPKPAAPARALVSFSLPTGRTDPFRIPQGTRLIGQRIGTGTDIPFETARELQVVPSRLIKVERSDARGQIDLTEEYRRGPYLYPFGGELGAPIGVGSALGLGFDRPFPPVQVTFTLELYEADLAPVGEHGEELPEVIPSAAVQWEYLAVGDRWLPLPDLTDETRALTLSGPVQFTGSQTPLPHRSKDLYWLRVRLTQSGHEIPPRITAIHLNTVTAIEGRLVPPKGGPVLTKIVGSGSGLPLQRIQLGVAPIVEAPIVAGSLLLEIQERAGGAWERWTEVPDFDASGPGDRHFVVDLSQGVLRFGNGLRGRIAPQVTDDHGQAVENIRASYRVGGGEQGNLAAGEIHWIELIGAEGIEVTNPEPATGGAGPESLADAWSRVRADLAIQYRAVTSEDFERLARATPGVRVARAKAIPGLDPQHPESAPADPCLVTVVVVPYSFTRCPAPSEGFLKTVCRHLDRHRLVTTDLRVIPPLYVEILVEVEVMVKAKSAPAVVKKRVEQAMEVFLDPLRGGAQKTGWPFGRSIYRSELANLIERVDGVECLVRLHLQTKGGTVRTDGDVEIPKIALVCPGRFQIEAKEPTPLCEVKPCPNPAHQ